jgi:drug/metabolite transporter (DMT)-like permease
MKTQEHTSLPEGRDIPFLLLGILGIGSSGPVIAKSVMPISTLVFWRNLGGALIIAPFAYRKKEWRVPSNRRSIRFSAISGVLLGFHFLAFFAAMRFTTVAAGTALASLQPIFTAIYLKFKGARISAQSMIGLFLAFGSVMLITGIDFTLSTRAFTGDLFGILSGALAAGYVLIGSGVQKTLSTSTYTTICYGTCAFVTLIAALLTRSEILHFQFNQWILLFSLIIGAQLLGHSLFNLTLKRVSPVVVSLIVFFEVPVSAVIALLWLNQKPQPGTIPGIIGLLIGCAIFVLRNKPIEVSVD